MMADVVATLVGTGPDSRQSMQYVHRHYECQHPIHKLNYQSSFPRAMSASRFACVAVYTGIAVGAIFSRRTRECFLHCWCLLPRPAKSYLNLLGF